MWVISRSEGSLAVKPGHMSTLQTDKPMGTRQGLWETGPGPPCRWGMRHQQPCSWAWVGMGLLPWTGRSQRGIDRSSRAPRATPGGWLLSRDRDDYPAVGFPAGSWNQEHRLVVPVSFWGTERAGTCISGHLWRIQSPHLWLYLMGLKIPRKMSVVRSSQTCLPPPGIGWGLKFSSARWPSVLLNMTEVTLVCTQEHLHLSLYNPLPCSVTWDSCPPPPHHIPLFQWGNEDQRGKGSCSGWLSSDAGKLQTCRQVQIHRVVLPPPEVSCYLTLTIKLS